MQTTRASLGSECSFSEPPLREFRFRGRQPRFIGKLLRTLAAVRCKLSLKEITEPTGGTQSREHWGGPTNGRAAACRHRPRRLEEVPTRPNGRWRASSVHHIASISSFHFACTCASVISPVFSSPLPSPRYCHLVPSGHGGLCASSALGLSQAQ